MLVDPGKPLLHLIQESIPGRDVDFYFETLKSARGIIERMIGGLPKRAGTTSPPIPVDRVAFCWRILRQADVLIWRTKKGDLPKTCKLPDARRTLGDLLGLGTSLTDPLLSAVLDALRVESARYLYHYWFFRRHLKKPSQLPPPFDRAVEREDWDLIRRVIWWSLRSRREEYIEISQAEPVRVEFAFLVETILHELPGWCGREVAQLTRLPGEVEAEINRWLKYSKIQVAASPDEDAEGTDLETQREIARAFLKHNELDTKLHIHRAGSGAPRDDRIAELELRIQQYAEENRSLEDKLKAAQAAPSVVADISMPVDTAPFTELREALRTIDSKYSFDTLNSVQLGGESHLTLRSFVANLFYSLRKRGFGEYPKDETFDLPYEASGLYECEGFEVQPGGSDRVKVVRRGWALHSRGRVLPIRRARVTPV